MLEKTRSIQRSRSIQSRLLRRRRESRVGEWDERDPLLACYHRSSTNRFPAWETRKWSEERVQRRWNSTARWWSRQCNEEIRHETILDDTRTARSALAVDKRHPYFRVEISECFEMFSMTNIIILGLIKNRSNSLLHFERRATVPLKMNTERTNARVVDGPVNSIRTSNKGVIIVQRLEHTDDRDRWRLSIKRCEKSITPVAVANAWRIYCIRREIKIQLLAKSEMFFRVCISLLYKKPQNYLTKAIRGRRTRSTACSSATVQLKTMDWTRPDCPSRNERFGSVERIATHWPKRNPCIRRENAACETTRVPRRSLNRCLDILCFGSSLYQITKIRSSSRDSPSTHCCRAMSSLRCCS